MQDKCCLGVGRTDDLKVVDFAARLRVVVVVVYGRRSHLLMLGHGYADALYNSNEHFTRALI